MSAKRSDLEILNIIHRNGIRLSLGAFKTSRKWSLYVEANELPLFFRREELAMRYALKIKANRDNPVYDSIYKLPYKHLYEHSNFKSFGETVNSLFRDSGINHSKIMPRHIPNYPPWLSEPNDVSFELSMYDKKTTLSDVFRAKFSEILPIYSDYQQFYTDGSKQDHKASYGFYCDLGSMSSRISNNSSIFTAETEAIRRVLKYIDTSTRSNKKYVIFTDSRSVLESIYNQDSRNPLILETLDKIEQLKEAGNIIKFCWVPSHVGIRGNEVADRRAREALTENEPVHYKFPHTDYKSVIRMFIHDKWQNHWDFKNTERSNKLYKIIPKIKPYSITNLKRREEVIIHRLRIGHTRLTHRYLMEDPLKREPICNYCYLEQLSINHIFTECQHFERIRSRHFRVNDMKQLFEKVPYKHIFNFLKQSKLYDEI